MLALEFASGLPYGVVNELVPVWLRTEGVGLAEIGALSLVGIPWSLKPLWGPFVDRLGTYRRWMMAGLLGATVATAGLMSDLPVVPLLLLIATCSAVQDVAIDGWLVAAVPKEEQGRVTGFRVAGYRGAMALGGGGGILLGARYGWEWAVVAVIGVQLAIMAVEYVLPDPGQDAPQAHVEWLTTLRAWLTQPGALALFAFALLFKLGDSAISPMVKPFWLDAGLTPEEVGIFSTTVGAVLAGVGAIGGGELISRIGLLRGALLLGVFAAVSNLGYALAALSGGRGGVYAASTFESLSVGFGSAAALSIFMRGCGGAQAATRFAILTAIIVLTRNVAGAFSGLGVERYGYPAYFAVTFLLALPGLLLVVPVTRRLG